MDTDGYSYSTGESNISTCTFKLNIKVERKNFWGNWVYGNFTSCSLPHSWEYRFALQKTDTPLSADIFYSQDLSTTPVTHSYPTSYWPSINYLIVELEPNGVNSCANTGYDTYYSAVDVYAYNFTAYLEGITLQVNK